MTYDPYAQPPADDDRRGWDQQQPGYGQPSEYGQPGYGQPPAYGQPAGPYPYPQPRQDQKAVWALVLAILGWFLCPLVLHIVAIVLANQSVRAIRASQGWLTGEGLANAARIVAIIGLIIYAVGVVLLIIGLAAVTV